VLKSGGACYLPIDPRLPSDRIELMRADAAPVFVIEEIPPLDGCPDTDPGVAARRRQRGVLIYTSGSTGRPEGRRDLAPQPGHAVLRAPGTPDRAARHPRPDAPSR
jgi:non-ribosomal peptide synthetase component F